jgi:hypothetical protein
MYHEEKMIDGRLKWRSTPDGEWHEYTYQQLSQKYAALEKDRDDLQQKYNELAAER